MQYSKLIWTHSHAEMPREILSEYDAEGWEQRKVEIFADGAMSYASQHESSNGAQLSLIQRPSDDEVRHEPEKQNSMVIVFSVPLCLCG